MAISVLCGVSVSTCWPNLGEFTILRGRAFGAHLRVFVDTDFAGCQLTRRSTSGGRAMHGAHIAKHWSTTQKAVTLSSGEAELGVVVKGVGEGIGL